MSTCPLCKSENCQTYPNAFICWDCGNRIDLYTLIDPRDQKASETTETDGTSEFKHVWSKIRTKTVVCLKGVNRVFEGELQLIKRRGKSVFGNELVFQFIIHNELRPYEAKSPLNHIEFYFPQEKAEQMLKAMLNKMEEDKGEKT